MKDGLSHAGKEAQKSKKKSKRVKAAAKIISAFNSSLASYVCAHPGR